jgi:hypothetical protein
MLAFSEKWTVTPDTIHYTYYIMITTGGDIKKELHVATPEELWSRLLDNCNLSVFSKIDDGISWLPMDGTDEVYTVKTSTGERAVTNGWGDNYEQPSEFFELILEQVALYRKKATL